MICQPHRIDMLADVHDSGCSPGKGLEHPHGRITTRQVPKPHSSRFSGAPAAYLDRGGEPQQTDADASCNARPGSSRPRRLRRCPPPPRRCRFRPSLRRGVSWSLRRRSGWDDLPGGAVKVLCQRYVLTRTVRGPDRPDVLGRRSLHGEQVVQQWRCRGSRSRAGRARGSDQVPGGPVVQCPPS